MKIRLRDGSEKAVDIKTGANLIQAAEYVRWYDALPAGRIDKIELLDLAFPAFLGAVPKFKIVLNGNLTSALEKASD